MTASRETEDSDSEESSDSDSESSSEPTASEVSSLLPAPVQTTQSNDSEDVIRQVTSGKTTARGSQSPSQDTCTATSDSESSDDDESANQGEPAMQQALPQGEPQPGRARPRPHRNEVHPSELRHSNHLREQDHHTRHNRHQRGRFTNIVEEWKQLVQTPSSRLIAFRSIHLHTSADVILMNLDWNERATTPITRMFAH